MGLESVVENRHRVLVIDDDLPYLPFYEKRLSQHYDVQLCVDRKHLSNIIREPCNYDLVIIDTNFACMGIRALREIKIWAKMHAIKIIIHSHESDEILSSLLNGPVVDFAKKPCLECVLVCRLKNAIHNGSTSKSSASPHPSIFLIDTDRDDCERLSEALSCDYNVTYTPSSKDAVRLLSDEIVPEVIVMNMQLNEIHGLELLERIKSIPAIRDIPIICLSRLDVPLLIIGAIECGAYDYIPKSSKTQVLKHKIERAMESSYLVMGKEKFL